MPGCLYSQVYCNTKLEGVQHFHYYLCRQLKGDGMEISMKEEITTVREKTLHLTEKMKLKILF